MICDRGKETQAIATPNRAVKTPVYAATASLHASNLNQFHIADPGSIHHILLNIPATLPIPAETVFSSVPSAPRKVLCQ
jgi:hypothetical protein